MSESLRTLITQTYQSTVAIAEVPSELKESLKTHERVPAFLTNLYQELKATPQATAEEVRSITEALTYTFLSAVDQKAKENMMSDAEKSRILQEQQDAQIIRNAADTGNITEEVINVLNKE
jgi:imidazolonepropionase-like amidohydrolase